MKTASTSLARFIFVPAVLGMMIALLFAATWLLLESRMDLYRVVHPFLSAVQTLLWPASFFMIAAASGGAIYWQVLSLATLANGLLYGLVGLLIWTGLYKNWIGFAAAALLVLFVWALLFVL